MHDLKEILVFVTGKSEFYYVFNSSIFTKLFVVIDGVWNGFSIEVYFWKNSQISNGAAETMCVNGWNNRPTNTVYAILQAYQSSQTKVRVENCSRRAINQSQFAAALFVL